jgi:probable HAF family extracellular repeat protein
VPFQEAIMKKQTLRLPVLMLSRLIGLTLSTALAVAVPAVAQHHHYKLIDTGTLGGANSSLGFEGERDINNRGTILSLAETTIPDPTCFFPDCFIGHTVQWQDGVLEDLGALPPVNNSGPLWISDSGLISGWSENGLTDPLTGAPEFQAVLFKDGNIINLGGLGGNESAASGVNNRGQVVGCATTAVVESYSWPYGQPCLGPQQSRAFMWQGGTIKDLGTLGGSDALGELVNDRGQIAGWSLTDSTVNPATGVPTQHPFLWEHGKMRDLGTIGGTAVYLVNSLNNGGQIVGGMNVAGDQSYHPFLWDGHGLRDLGTFGGDRGSANWVSEAGAVVGWAYNTGDLASHGFLWRKGELTDLGTVDGDSNSVAFVVNSKDQVVGSSQDSNLNYLHAFLWEQGLIADLNALVVPSDASVQLFAAPALNERGEIVAQGALPNGDQHVYLLIPCDDDHPGVEGCDYTLVDANAHRPTSPAVRETSRPTPPMVWRGRNRFHAPALGPRN